jgi:diguanylate cyclase (GGDEF)-like protein/PAS domain S-box-containing protein
MKITSILPIFLVTALLGVGSIVIITYVSLRDVERFREEQQVALARSAADAQGFIGEIIEERKALVRAFAANNAARLQDALEQPANQAVQARIKELIHAYFPSGLTFLLGPKAGSPGNGETTQPDRKYELTGEWTSGRGQTGVLGISFSTEHLAMLLRGYEVPGHNLLLLKRDPSDLIVAAADGGLENIGGAGSLTGDELKSLQFRLPVAMTGWDVAYLPSEAKIQNQADQIYFRAVAAIAFVVGVMTLFAVWYFVAAAVRRSVLKENNELLNQSYRDRSMLKTLIDLVPIPIFRNYLGRIELVNDAYAKLIGKPADELLGKTLADLYGADAAGEMQKINAELIAEPGSTRVYERRLKPFDGDTGRDVIVYKTCMQPDGDEQPSIIGAIVDMTEEKALRSKLEILAMTDPLTGIANRRKFMSVLKVEYQRHVRYGHPLSIVLLDIDHFKAINDTYGHEFGDEVIKIVARVLEDSIREDLDLAARIGGEEFALLLPETNAAGARVVAERVRNWIENRKITRDGDELHVTVSTGVAGKLRDDEALEPDQLLNNADKALYTSKDKGRNKTTIFGED